MRYFKNMMTFGTALSGLVVSLNGAWAAQAVVPGPQITLAQELQAIRELLPTYQAQETDPVGIKGVEDNQADMDGLLFGTATLTGSSYWLVDTAASKARVTFTRDDEWKTYEATGLPSSWSASGNIVFTETKSNGATPGAPSYTVTIILTRTGAPANLTIAQLKTFLSAAPVTTLAAANTGTALTSTGGLVAGTAAAGWTAKAWASGSNGTTPVATVLDPISTTLNVATTSPVSGSILFTTAIKDMDTWNVAVNATTAFPIQLTANGRGLTLNVYPGQFVRTSATSAGIATGLVNVINTRMPKRLDAINTAFLGDIPTAVAWIRSLIDSSPSGSTVSMLQSKVENSIAAASFVIGDFTTTADSNNYGLIAFTPAAISSVTWKQDNKKIIATGKIGVGGKNVDFTCDLAGKTVIKDDTNQVIKFVSTDGQSAFWVKSFDSTGLDTSGETSINASQKETFLASQVLALLEGVTSIDATTMNAL